MNLSYETLNMLLNGWMDWIHITSSAQSSDIASQLLLSTHSLCPPVFSESYFLISSDIYNNKCFKNSTKFLVTTICHDKSCRFVTKHQSQCSGHPRDLLHLHLQAAVMADKCEYEPVDNGDGKKKVSKRSISALSYRH